MGARPVEAVVGLGLPRAFKATQVRALYRGLKAAARRFGCAVVGGDTNRSASGWVIAVAAAGECDGPPVLRSGVRPGDSLWVTGTLGTAALGWESRRRGKRSPVLAPFQRRHARPEPRLRWGEALRKSGWIGAMIDVSDGLAGDVRHLAEASGVGFRIAVEAVPRHPRFMTLCRRLELSWLRLLLGGGEDYELLFTVRRGKERDAAQYFKRHRIPAARIGEARPGGAVQFFQNGKGLLRQVDGFRHF
ncbi:MAG: thiamine-phosphate kinase, partial [Candidatus Binatia bacterium]